MQALLTAADHLARTSWSPRARAVLDWATARRLCAASSVRPRVVPSGWSKGLSRGAAGQLREGAEAVGDRLLHGLSHGLCAFDPGPQGIGHVLCHPLNGFALLTGPPRFGSLGFVNIRHLILHGLGYDVSFLIAQDLEHGGKQFFPVVTDVLLEGASEAQSPYR